MLYFLRAPSDGIAYLEGNDETIDSVIERRKEYPCTQLPRAGCPTDYYSVRVMYHLETTGRPKVNEVSVSFRGEIRAEYLKYWSLFTTPVWFESSSNAAFMHRHFLQSTQSIEDVLRRYFENPTLQRIAELERAGYEDEQLVASQVLPYQVRAS